MLVMSVHVRIRKLLKTAGSCQGALGTVDMMTERTRKSERWSACPQVNVKLVDRPLLSGHSSAREIYQRLGISLEMEYPWPVYNVRVPSSSTQR